jgi:uncharacterized membrane protein
MKSLISVAEAMTTPIWALSIAFWLHMLATVLWIGGLVVLSLLVLPAARKTLELTAYASLLADIERRLDPLGWFSILILIASGMIQMSASPQYEGFLSIRSLWSGTILVKHLLFVIMVTISGYITWGVMPQLRRAALLHSRGKDVPDLGVLQRRSVRFMQINLVFGVLVLLLTAIARSV